MCTCDGMYPPGVTKPDRYFGSYCTLIGRRAIEILAIIAVMLFVINNCSSFGAIQNDKPILPSTPSLTFVSKQSR